MDDDRPLFSIDRYGEDRHVTRVDASRSETLPVPAKESLGRDPGFNEPQPILVCQCTSRGCGVHQAYEGEQSTEPTLREPERAGPKERPTDS